MDRIEKIESRAVELCGSFVLCGKHQKLQVNFVLLF
jgi:hypothetical protein